MKQLFFIILFSFIFGDIYLPKYSSVESESKSDVFFLKTNEFDGDSELYFQLNAENGYVSPDVIYEFSNYDPTDSHIFTNPTKLECYTTGESSIQAREEVMSFTTKYYFEVKNDCSQKYLYVKYSDLTGKSVEIESTRYSLYTLIFIIIGIVVGVIVFIGIIIGVFFLIKYKRRYANYSQCNYNKNNNDNNNDNNEPQNQKDNDNECQTQNPDSYNSNYPQQQQTPNTNYQPPNPI